KLLFVMQAPVSGFARSLAALAEKKAGEEAA
ncbi:50S ribosomal protein L10, partial [Neisseria gonorrhoeae]